jgi:RNA recognition motif-containing protein
MRSTVKICGLLLAAASISQAWMPIATTRTPLNFSRQRTATTSLNGERRFAQPNTNKKYGADSKIASIHEKRLKTAGRVGTKRYIDPCKVFIGNLPFNVDDTQLKEFVMKIMGQSKIVLHSSKVIHDWKTGKSKGYGFVQFIDPIYATTCMDQVHGQKLNGRPVSVSQGKKKEQESELYLNKKKKKPETDEEAVISSALDEAESEEEIPEFGGGDEDIELDAALFGIVGDDDDDDYDGVFLEKAPQYEGEIDPDLNREQRREAGRRLKRKKKESKGFGSK